MDTNCSKPRFTTFRSTAMAPADATVRIAQLHVAMVPELEACLEPGSKPACRP
jgi:hypothetical protein